MRRIRIRPEALLAIHFVVLVVALEPLDVTVGFERQDVRRDAIEEPAIMRDHDFPSASDRLRPQHRLHLL